MIYEVRARILFTEADEARDFYHDSELALAKGGGINPGQENFEFSTIEILENYHDQDPNEPCRLLDNASKV